LTTHLEIERSRLELQDNIRFQNIELHKFVVAVAVDQLGCIPSLSNLQFSLLEVLMERLGFKANKVQSEQQQLRTGQFPSFFSTLSSSISSSPLLLLKSILDFSLDLRKGISHIGNGMEGPISEGSSSDDADRPKGQSMTTKPPWQRLLWKKQPYPDNYVPDSFLDGLRTNCESRKLRGREPSKRETLLRLFKESTFLKDLTDSYPFLIFSPYSG
jgi:hypothetical protein